VAVQHVCVMAVPNTAVHCFVCQSPRGRHLVSKRVKLVHLYNGLLRKDAKLAICNMKLQRNYIISAAELSKLLVDVSKLASIPRLEFSDLGFHSEEDLLTLVGLRPEAFNRLLAYIKPFYKL